MKWDDTITLEDMEEFTAKHGARRTKLLMSVLGKHQGFFQAVNTEVGTELLKDLMNEMEALLVKIVDNEATDEQKMEYQIRRNILLSWSEKINNYTKHAKKLKEA